MILTADSFQWIHEQPDNSLPSVILSFPDYYEVKDSLEDLAHYKRWVLEFIETLFRKVQRDQYVIFIQTDTRINGIWLDKSHLIQSASNVPPLLFHKIIVKSMRPHIQRPTYSHILCFSPENHSGGGRCIFEDVIDRGDVLWRNGTSIEALGKLLRFLHQRGIRKILDPFCGHGTIAMVAREYGIQCDCIDIDPHMIEITTKNLQSPQ